MPLPYGCHQRPPVLSLHLKVLHKSGARARFSAHCRPHACFGQQSHGQGSRAMASSKAKRVAGASAATQTQPADPALTPSASNRAPKAAHLKVGAVSLQHRRRLLLQDACGAAAGSSGENIAMQSSLHTDTAAGNIAHAVTNQHTPERPSRPPGFVYAASRGARATSGPCRMLATVTSNCRRSSGTPAAARGSCCSRLAAAEGQQSGFACSEAALPAAAAGKAQAQAATRAPLTRQHQRPQQPSTPAGAPYEKPAAPAHT